MGTRDSTVFMTKEQKGYAILWKISHILTTFNVSGTQNITCTTAWLTIYLTASGPTEQAVSFMLNLKGR